MSPQRCLNLGSNPHNHMYGLAICICLPNIQDLWILLPIRVYCDKILVLWNVTLVILLFQTSRVREEEFHLLRTTCTVTETSWDFVCHIPGAELFHLLLCELPPELGRAMPSPLNSGYFARNCYVCWYFLVPVGEGPVPNRLLLVPAP